MESKKFLLPEEKVLFKDYKDMRSLQGKGTQGQVNKVLSFKDDTEFAMKAISA